MSLHSTNPALRQVFASQQTTQLFVNTYKTFVSSIAAVPVVDNQLTIRLLEKLTHFGLALALDNAVAGVFKREVYMCGVRTLSIVNLIVDPGYFGIRRDDHQSHCWEAQYRPKSCCRQSKRAPTNRFCEVKHAGW